MLKIDLHIHSYYSCDGEYSPQDLIKIGASEGIKHISITDHNTVEGVDEALKSAEEYGVDLIPGIEIDSLFQNQVIHILGYYLNWKSSKLKDLSAAIKSEQLKIVQLTIEKLNRLGLKVNYQQVLKYSNSCSMPGYASIAEALLENQVNYKHDLLKPLLTEGNNLGRSNRNERPIFDLLRVLMYPGKPAHVASNNYPGAQDVIKIILKLKGVPVLAHPGLYFSPEKETDISKINILKSFGLKGIEAFSSYHSEKETKEFYQLSKKLNMLITEGSDFHGKLKPDIKMGKGLSDAFEIIAGLNRQPGIN